MSSPILVMVCETSSGDRPTEGSSISSRRGDDISARAIASICCWPPDMVPASWLLQPLERRKGLEGERKVAYRCSCRAALRKAPSSRFSTTVSFGNSRRPSGTSATPRSTMASVDSLVRSCAVPSIVEDHAAALRPDQARRRTSSACSCRCRWCRARRRSRRTRHRATDAAQRLDGAVTRIEILDGEAKCQDRPPARAGWP